MGEAIGQILPVGIGVALSPLPIIAVVLILTTRQARVNGPSFVAGWLAGLAVVGALVLLLAGPAGVGDGGPPPTWASWLLLLFGMLLLAVATSQFRHRARAGQDPTMPSWMDAIDRFTPAQSAGTAALLAGANPKNTLLAIGAAATIAQTGISAGEQAIAYGVFALIGTLGVGIPVILYLAYGERSAARLDALKDWMTRHNAVIMSLLCLVIGAKLIGDAIGALTS